MRRRDPALAGVAAVLAALLLVCGPDPDPNDEPSPERAGPAPSATAETDPPEGKDVPLRQPVRPGGRPVPVLRVVDGDTIHIFRNGRDETIRLIGIDTPEVDWYGGEAECYGARAGRFLMRMVEGERVRLEPDRDRIDPYDRTLAYVYLEDGRMVNEVMVRRGFAEVTIHEPNDRHEERLRAAEAEARRSGTGLWSVCHP